MFLIGFTFSKFFFQHWSILKILSEENTHKIHIIFIVGKERVQNKPEHQIRDQHSTCICL
jgi:hypothetical protein